MLDRASWVASGHHIEVALADGPSDVFVRVAGEGPWCTLVHGYLTSSWDWAHVADALEAERRTLALDLLGFGASAKPHDHRYSIHEQADIVEACWRAEGVAATHLVSHDYGDSVAQELVARALEGTLGVGEPAVVVHPQRGHLPRPAPPHGRPDDAARSRPRPGHRRRHQRGDVRHRAARRPRPRRCAGRRAGPALRGAVRPRRSRHAGSPHPLHRRPSRARRALDPRPRAKPRPAALRVGPRRSRLGCPRPGSPARALPRGSRRRARRRRPLPAMEAPAQVAPLLLFPRYSKAQAPAIASTTPCLS